MPKVTVGVPVYNGDPHLAESLDCLINQTLTDIEILVYDNASTDTTPDIIRAYAERDPRIKYVRQPENVGLLRNFLDVVNACKTDYFCWRAYDDLSSLDYLEKLCDALDANPQADLAVAHFVTTIDGVPHKRQRDMPPLTGRPMKDIRRQVKRPNPCAYYGLWRTKAVRPLFTEVVNEYGAAWASDPLLLSSILMKRSFVIVPEVTFFQRHFSTAVKGYSRPDLAELRELRRAYYRIVSRHIDGMNLSPINHMRVKYYAWLSMGRSLFKFRRIVLRTVRAPIYKMLGKQ